MRKERWYSKLYVWVVMLFLYAPIFVLIAYSFNANKSRGKWTGFTLNWYTQLFQNELIIRSLINTLLVALFASVIATVLGTAADLGINGMKKRSRALVMNITYMPIINPEIVTGVSLMLLFVSARTIYGEFELGFFTLVLAHISFCTPYVILNVLHKLRQMDRFIYEAALDLGCSPRLAFFKVVLPEIMPGITAGFLMALTYSVDDFIISYFNSGSSFQTLPVTIYSMTRKRLSPEINALSTIIFAVILLILLVVNLRGGRKERAATRKGGEVA